MKSTVEDELGKLVGVVEGVSVGTALGLEEGAADGAELGLADGTKLGLADGAELGLSEGGALGLAEGAALGVIFILYFVTSICNAFLLNQSIYFLHFGTIEFRVNRSILITT